MAGDWIKMRGSLSSHPKVLRIASIIEASTDVGKKLSTGFSGCLAEIVTRDVTRDVTLASLLRVWGATNEHTCDGVWHGLKPCDLDHVAVIPGFGQAMEDVGWAVYDETADTTTMPDFLLYNVPAKGGRGSAAERQKRYRDRKKRDADSDVTRDTTITVTSDIEKRREEKSKNKPRSAPKVALPDWVPVDAWDGYVEMRVRIKHPLTDRAKALELKTLQRLKGEGHDPREVLDCAVASSWRGLYPPKAAGKSDFSGAML